MGAMAIEMNNQRWLNTCEYLQDVFGRPDNHLATLMERAVAAGLPDIAVTADVGRLLMLLTQMTGARRALELGTLAGYSAIWIARGLSPGGRLITLEPDDNHADFAEQMFREANLADCVEIRRAAALDAIPTLREEFGEESFDLIFLDAIKTEYSDYFDAARTLIRPGGLLIADNALGGGDWWIDDPAGSHESRDAIERFNRQVADDPDFEAACVPIREGVMIARREA